MQCHIYIKIYSNLLKECSTVLLECLTVLLESIDLFDTIDDITQKNFEGAPPPTFQGCSVVPSLPLGSYMQYCTACLNLDSDIQKGIRSQLWINIVKKWYGQNRSSRSVYYGLDVYII